MYAVIKTGGKQYQVSKGDHLLVEKLPGESGTQIEFDQVLLVADGENIQVGAPFVEKAKVKAQVIEEVRGEKIRIITLKRRKHHRKTKGHRQTYTKVEVTDIQAS